MKNGEKTVGKKTVKTVAEGEGGVGVPKPPFPERLADGRRPSKLFTVFLLKANHVLIPNYGIYFFSNMHTVYTL